MLRKQRILALLIVLAMLASSIPAPVLAAATAEWSGTFTGTHNNTTTTTALPTDPNRIQKTWQAQVGNNTIVILGDYIYTYNGVSQAENAAAGGTLYKLDKQTGSIVATMECSVGSSYYYSYIIYAGGLLYIGCPDAVMAVDPDSFTLLWTATVPMNMYPTLQYVGGCIVTNGTVLNANTGATVKTLPGSYSWSSGAEVNGYFYVASANGNLYAFHTTTWETADTLTYGGSGAGVMYYGGWLYWGDKVAGKLYGVQASDGAFVDSSLVAVDCGYSTMGAPVAAGNRIYLAGYRRDGSTEGTGYGAVCVFSTSDRSLIYTAQMSGTGHKIQCTPILSAPASGGNVVAGNAVPMSGGDGSVYIYVQDYASPGCVYVLADKEGQSSGTLQKLITPDPGDYAWEQLACDKDGALYVTTDAGYLLKYETAAVLQPQLATDLSAAEVLCGQNGVVAPLSVSAVSPDGGTLSYQWQMRTEGGSFTNIPGATADSYTPSTQEPGTFYYRCIVTNTLSGEKAEAYSKVAKITVREKQSKTGDLNGDGAVNMMDVTVLKRFLAGWTGYSVSVAHGDLNGDGVVNMMDVTVLKRHLAGWAGYEVL